MSVSFKGAPPSTELRQLCQKLIKDYPMLSLEDEKSLVLRWQNDGDQKALDRLLLSHMPFVLNQINKNAGYKVSADDLWSYAWVGLCTAANKYDPSLGFRFNTYARGWVGAEINQFVMLQTNFLKGPQSALSKAMFFQTNRIKTALGIDGALNEKNAPGFIEMIKKNVPSLENISVSSVLTIDNWMRTNFISVDKPVGSEEDSSTLGDFLKDDSDSQEEVYARSEEKSLKRKFLLTAINSVLSDRERDIFINRKLKEEPVILEVLSEKWNVSRERIRQIEVRSFVKVQEEVLKLIRDMKREGKMRVWQAREENKGSSRTNSSREEENFAFQM